MIDELELVMQARPEVDPPADDVRAAALVALERAIAEAQSRRSRRRWLPQLGLRLGRLAPAAALLVVVAVVAAFLGIHGRKAAAPASQGGIEFAFRAEPAAGAHGVNRASVAWAASFLQQLIASRGGGNDQVTVFTKADRVVVHLGGASRLTRLDVVSLAGITGRLAFYDWEANALTPSGKTVASLLPAGNRTAVQISQGGASGAGSAGGGSLSLYEAASLASRQAPAASAQNARLGPEYFLFGRPGSAACGAAQAAAYCYIAGPAQTAAEALDALPAGTPGAQARLFRVPRGTAILEATPGYRGAPPSLSDPGAQFYVLRDRAALVGTEVTNPRPGRGADGSRDVTFGFSVRGAAAFERVTAQIAHRGDLVSGFGDTLEQHFAVALGGQLISVPSIDFRTYPDGVSARDGADLSADWTTARTLATEVQLGSLPIVLTPTP